MTFKFLISFFLLNTPCNKEVSVETIEAIISQESSYYPNAISSTGDIGLMQVSIAALKDFNRIKKKNYDVNDLYNPAKNIEVGITHLCRFYQKGYTVDELILIYWMGHNGFIEFKSGDRPYLNKLAKHRLSKIRGYEKKYKEGLICLKK